MKSWRNQTDHKMAQNGVGFNYGLDHVVHTLLVFLRSATSHAPKWHYVNLLGLIASPDDRGRISDSIPTNLARMPPALYPESRPNSRIVAASRDDTPTPTADTVAVERVGQWGHTRRESAGRDPAMKSKGSDSIDFLFMLRLLRVSFGNRASHGSCRSRLCVLVTILDIPPRDLTLEGTDTARYQVAVY